MSVKSKSPLPKKKVEEQRLNFSQAIAKVIDGQTITKAEWNNQEIYGLLKDGFLVLRKEDGKHYQWILSDGDLLGEDWIVIQPAVIN